MVSPGDIDSISPGETM